MAGRTVVEMVSSTRDSLPHVRFAGPSVNGRGSRATTGAPVGGRGGGPVVTRCGRGQVVPGPGRSGPPQASAGVRGQT
ncbi:hypothetical protein GCM10014719_30270 [Planomonospora parontospora subsp. antibiotica]|nr:hypothetical protein GCM10014719_30270 [Planomonospora parontospora subsp. antibiotica]GII16126.1 hypothetical protein Ppa05_28520 [Planomonospora parontospora subsp. antibiotica]